MDSYKEIIGVITVIMTIILYGFYLRDTIKGKISPHPFSWIVWFTIAITVFLAQVSDNAGPGAWMNGAVCIFNFFIILASIKNGFSNIKPIDIIVFTISIIAVPVWIMTESAFWSVIILSFANTLAYIPTYRKSYHNPNNEPVYLYGINFFRHGLSITALTNYSTITMLSPFMLVINNGALAIFLLWRRKIIK